MYKLTYRPLGDVGLVSTHRTYATREEAVQGVLWHVGEFFTEAAMIEDGNY